MAENSNIEWTDHTFNPWIGCAHVGPGCDHCYAEALMDKRHGRAQWGGPGKGVGTRVRTAESTWAKPRAWERAAPAFLAAHGRRQRVFCASLADVFDNAVKDAWREDLAHLIQDTPSLDWLLLTKRIGNAAADLDAMFNGSVPPNVWLGATVVNQAEADRDVPKLLSTKHALGISVAFLSMEPLLGPVDLSNRPSPFVLHDGTGMRVNWLTGRFMSESGVRLTLSGSALDWIIVGGESGAGARPLHLDWARLLRDQCATAGVPFQFKQHGEFLELYDRDHDDPDWRRCDEVQRLRPRGRWLNLAGGHGFHGERVVYVDKVGKARAGRLLDGVEHNGFPEIAHA